MIETVTTTTSTNADLLARLHAGAIPVEGDWLVADRQQAGRGRLGRVWADGAGNFMGSTMVRVAPGDPPPATLALAAGVAVQAALAALLPPAAQPWLKWPNDVLVGGGKLAGMLLERGDGAVVVGVGVNLVAAPMLDGRTTVALAQFGQAPGRDRFAQALARCFADELARWRGLGLAPLIARWLAVAHPPGTALVVHGVADAPLAGQFAGLCADGALRLALADGTTRVVHAGEVMLA